MGIVIVSIDGNVYGVAVAPAGKEFSETIELHSPTRSFKRTMIKYRANGQKIYYYKRIDTNAK